MLTALLDLLFTTFCFLISVSVLQCSTSEVILDCTCTSIISVIVTPLSNTYRKEHFTTTRIFGVGGSFFFPALYRGLVSSSLLSEIYPIAWRGLKRQNES